MPAASEEETHSIGTFFIKAPVSESVGIRRGARTNYQKGTILLSERSICSQITAYSKNQKGNRRILKHRILSLMQNPAIFITSTGERAEINDSEWVGKAKSQNDNIHRRATKRGRIFTMGDRNSCSLRIPQLSADKYHSLPIVKILPLFIIVFKSATFA